MTTTATTPTSLPGDALKTAKVMAPKMAGTTSLAANNRCSGHAGGLPARESKRSRLRTERLGVSRRTNRRSPSVLTALGAQGRVGSGRSDRSTSPRWRLVRARVDPDLART